MPARLVLAHGRAFASAFSVTVEAEEPVVTSQATLAEFSRDATIYDTGAQLGQSTATVPANGTTDAADGAVIEARAVRMIGGPDFVLTRDNAVGFYNKTGALPVTALGGTADGGTYTVAAGETAYLINEQVNHNIDVEEGGTLIAMNARVNGHCVGHGSKIVDGLAVIGPGDGTATSAGQFSISGRVSSYVNNLLIAGYAADGMKLSDWDATKPDAYRHLRNCVIACPTQPDGSSTHVDGIQMGGADKGGWVTEESHTLIEHLTVVWDPAFTIVPDLIPGGTSPYANAGLFLQSTTDKVLVRHYTAEVEFGKCAAIGHHTTSEALVDMAFINLTSGVDASPQQFDIDPAEGSLVTLHDYTSDGSDILASFVSDKAPAVEAGDGSVAAVTASDPIYAEPETDWTQVGTASGGAFTGTLDVPLSIFFLAREVRVQGGAAARSVNRFGAGHVWSIWEQSNWGHLTSTLTSSHYGLYEPVTDNSALQVAWRGNGVELAKITEDAKETTPCTPSMVRMSNAFAAARPGEKLMLVFQTKTGTSIMDALTKTGEDATFNIAGPDRDWLEEKAVHDLATADGQSVGTVFIPGWIEAHIGYGQNLPENMLQTFTGYKANGDKTTLSTLWGNGVPRLPISHMQDGETTDATGASWDEGLYDMRYTRAVYMGPHGNDAAVIGEGGQLLAASTYSTIGDMPLYTDIAETDDFTQMIQNARAIWKSSENPAVLDYPGETQGAYRNPSDVIHFDAGDADGKMRYASIGLYYMLRATGLTDYGEPVLDGRYDDPAGNFADFWIVGRDITTERKRRGEALPAALAPHHTEVMGWSINKQAATDATIQTASAHPVLPDGQTFVRVRPNSGTFSATDEIVYGYGVYPGHLVAEDYARKTMLDWLVVDMGQPDALLPAMPVQFQHRSPLPTTLAAPDAFKVSGDLLLRTDTSDSITGDSAARMHIHVRFDSIAGTGYRPMRIGNNWSINVAANGRLTLEEENGTGSISTDAGFIIPGAFYDIEAVVDQSAGSAELIVDGTSIGTSTPSSTGTFEAGRFDIFAGSGKNEDPVNGTFIACEAWLGQTAGTGDPTYAVEPIASAPHYQLRDRNGIVTLVDGVGGEFERAGSTTGTPTDGTI